MDAGEVGDTYIYVQIVGSVTRVRRETQGPRYNNSGYVSHKKLQAMSWVNVILTKNHVLFV